VCLTVAFDGPWPPTPSFRMESEVVGVGVRGRGGLWGSRRGCQLEEAGNRIGRMSREY